MALRQIRTYGDPVLEKKCREVKEVTPRLKELIGDMLETMYNQDGVGLAAPQVGVLRRIVVIDVTGAEGEEEEQEPEQAGSGKAKAQGRKKKGKEKGKKKEKEREKGGVSAGADMNQKPQPEEASAAGNLRPDGTQFPAWAGPLIMINPEIIETWGEQKGSEACLSVPGKAGDVTRPSYVRARALNEKMEAFEVEGSGLLARAICHELDHLDGVVYVTRVEGDLYEVKSEDEE